jgi:flagellar assembly protein FliH
MKLFTKGCIVKSCNVAVSTPHVVKWKAEFLQADTTLTELTVDEEVQYSAEDDFLGASLLEAEAKEKASLILAQAEADAQEILAQAEADAQEIRVQAQTDLDRLRSEVIEAAKTEVYPAAQADGYQAGIQAGELEGSLLSQKANRLLQMAQHAVQEEYAKVDGDLLRLAIKIAERLVRSSLAIEPQRLMRIIQALVLLPQERQGWRLHVAPEDALWLEGNQLPCPWVTDESLNPGDCYLDCQEGIFDARLEAQLEKLEHTLREELEHGSLEPIDSDGGRD